MLNEQQNETLNSLNIAKQITNDLPEVIKNNDGSPMGEIKVYRMICSLKYTIEILENALAIAN